MAFVSGWESGKRCLRTASIGRWDVTFREDDCRVRQGHRAEHLARFRRLAVGLLKREKSFRAGLKRKRLRCALDLNYLSRVVAS